LQTLLTIADFIRWGASRFSQAGLCYGHGTDNALDEAVALVLAALHLPPDLHQVWFQGRLTEEERERVIHWIQRRINERLPLPYLTGEAWFAGMRFLVSPQVLIPRSPMAELIENGFAPWIDPTRVDLVLDLCCGSGCIGIATAAYLPESRVDLADISPQALEVCRGNLQLHDELSGHIQLFQSDLFESLPPRRYDIIVSNPPYVGSGEMAELPPEYRHEPVLALQAEDEGLGIVRRILRESADFLAPDGILIVEVGNSAALVEQRYPEVPFVWLDFERGGEGVFLLGAQDLAEYAGRF
jgi:ribosomal protein L3 glutamine methyltransferase